MTESLRQESSIDIDQPLKLLPNRVLAVLVDQPLSATLWTPPEDRSVFARAIAVTPPRGTESKIYNGGRIVIPAHIGVKFRYYGMPAVICQYGEVLACIEEL